MKEPKSTAAWRDTGRTVKFAFVNARVLAPLIFMIIPGLPWVVILALLAISIFLAVLDYFKITPVVFFRMLRTKIAGPMKIVRQVWM